jgi:transcriptional regulator with XRE-family HTH domain
MNRKSRKEEYSENFIKFASRLKEERELKNLSIKQMSERLNISYEAYRRYETKGQNFRKPGLLTLVKIAKTLNVALHYLLGLQDEKF